MKKIFFFVVLLLTTTLNGQVSKTITVTAGNLSGSLSANEKSTITNLTVKGTIDARDFKTMDNAMGALKVIDISATNIISYTGTGGTINSLSNYYPADTIPTNAFYYGTLTSIVLPNSAKAIGQWAFYMCSKLVNVEMKSNISALGKFSFSGCYNLATLNLPSSLTYIGSDAFSGCSSMTTISIPTSVTTLGVNAFNGSGLVSISIPSSITYLSATTFMDCTSLTTCILPNTMSIIGSEAFHNCQSLTSFTIPSSVTYIAGGAFSACNGLKSINIPSGVTYIGSTVFADCTGLTSIYASPAKPVDINPINTNDVFTNVNKSNCTLFVPIGSKSAYQLSAQWKNFTNIVEINQTVGYKTVNLSPGGLFNSLSSDELNTITHLTILGTIDARDFKTMRDKMPKLSSIDIKAATIAPYEGTEGTYDTNSTFYPINEIPANAFYNGALNKTLTSIIPPTSLTSIGSQAFCYSSTLLDFTVSSLVTNIGDLAFDASSAAITVDVNNPNYSSLNGVLFDKNKTKLIQCPISKVGSFTIISSVTTIGAWAFENCELLTTINLPPSLSKIEAGAFCNCNALAGQISIPSTVSSIENYAFVYCSGVVNVDNANLYYSSNAGILFNKQKTTIVGYPTYKTGSYSIPSTVTTVGSLAFYYCSALTSITLPSSVISIGNYAFYGCSGLTSIYAYPTTIVDLTSIQSVFYDVKTTTCTLYVPSGKKLLYQNAIQWQDFTNIVEMTTGLNDCVSNKISIYQNPATGNYKVTGLTDRANVNITDISGKLLITQTISDNEELNINTLHNGVYVVTILSANKTVNCKIIKKKF
jgi:hypothetical protein